MALLVDVLEEAHKEHIRCTETGDNPGLVKVLETYNGILNQAPADGHVLFLVATVNLQLGNNGLAINLLKRVLEIHSGPDLPEVWNNLGSAYKAEHMDDKARTCYEHALELKRSSDILNNLSTLYINNGIAQDGLKYADEALELEPNNNKAHWNRSLILLEMGRWAEGFKEYDYGLLAGDRPDRQYSNTYNGVPAWNGEDLTGKTIVVYGEQGMGDEIMFASALEDLKGAGAKVIFECHNRMESLFRRNFPWLEALYPTRKKNTIEWPNDHKLDYRVAIGSLFKHFRSNGVFPRKPYLNADPAKVAYYRGLMESVGPGPYIGIGWAGGSKKTSTHERSFKLNHLKPILEQEATFISLQYTDGADEKLGRFYADSGIKIHHWNAVSEFNYDETVALIEALDLIIAPNTTAVHVAGALGKRCWTLTPDACAWRYSQGGEHMVMYGNHVTQFREHGGWEMTITEVAESLERFRGALREAV